MVEASQFAPPTITELEFISSRFKIVSSGCWEWFGNKNRQGYGKVPFRGRVVVPHRLIYQTVFGEIDRTLVSDHTCENKSCVNPRHIDPVTTKENIFRGTAPASVNARKTHCVNGHEFNQKNTYTLNNMRACRVCSMYKERRKRARQKDAS